VHDIVHEIAKEDSKIGKGFEGIKRRFFKEE